MAASALLYCTFPFLLLYAHNEGDDKNFPKRDGAYRKEEKWC
ncbi:hypothetical protein B4113_3294 [Geobacillus sp. B4113_201601]|nr:hypothetical protein B4113_3294 [Geobacillus sp. B4113_201601]